MSALDFSPCLAFTLLPNNDGQPLHLTQGDPGGATNEGVTFKTYSGWCASMHQPALMADFKALTPASVPPIYGSVIWNPVHGDSLLPGVDLMVFDFAVTSGPAASAKLLQMALGFIRGDVDGWIGPDTLKAMNAANPLSVVSSLLSYQLNYYRNLSGWNQFGNGWSNRTYRRRTASLAMITGHVTPIPAAPKTFSPVTSETEADILNQQQLDQGTTA